MPKPIAATASKVMMVRIDFTGGEKTVTELVTSTRMGHANVSKHLRVLRDERLVSFRKAGLQSFYRISDPIVFKLCDLLCNSLRNELNHQPRSRKPARKSPR